jgi:transposase-like protein
MSGISKSQVSRLCEEIDRRVKAFLDRPLEGDWPARGPWCGYQPVRGRDLLDGLPQEAGPACAG